MQDLTAARVWGIVREPTASGPVVPDDKGYLGEDCIGTPCRGRNKPAAQKDANRCTRTCCLWARSGSPTPRGELGEAVRCLRLAGELSGK